MRALILDSGGVLLRPDGALIARSAAELGVSVEPGRAVAAIHLADRRRDLGPDGGRPFGVYWAEAVGCDPDLGVRLWEQVLARVHPLRLWSWVNSDAEGFLRGLDRRIPRFVVTSSEGDAHHELAGCDLRALVDGVLDSTQVGLEKPDLRLFLMAAVAMDVPLEKCLYVSDTLDGPREGVLTAVLYDPFDVYADAASLPVERRVGSLGELAPMLAVPPGSVAR